MKTKNKSWNTTVFCFHVCDEDHMWFVCREFIRIPPCLDHTTSPEGRVSNVFVDIIAQASLSSLLRTVLHFWDAELHVLWTLKDRTVD